MRRSGRGAAVIAAVVAMLAVALMAGILLVVVCGPLLTEPGTHAAEDAEFGLIVFLPLWIAGAAGVLVAVRLWQGRSGRWAGLAWAAWAAITGLLVGAITGMTTIIGLALSSGSDAIAGYNLARADLYISVVLWVAAAVVAVSMVALGSTRSEDASSRP